MTVFFFFLVVQICVLLYINLRYFLRTRDYNTLIPAGTQMAAITIALLVSMNKSGTNNYLELVVLFLGFAIPLFFLMFDKPLLKKKLTLLNLNFLRNKKREKAKDLVLEPLPISSEKDNDVILCNLKSSNFLSIMEEKLNYSSRMLQKGHIEEALKIYEIYNEAIYDVNLSYNYGNLLYKMGDYDKALVAYTKSLEILESTAETKVVKGIKKESSKHRDETKKEILSNMANTYHMLGKNVESLSFYQKVMSIDGDYKPALDNYIQVLVSTKNFDEAVKYCKNLCRKGPDHKYHFMLAKIYFELNKTDNCIRELEKSLKIKQNNRGSLELLAEVYSSNDRVEDAIKVFYKLIKVCPENSSVHYSLGKMLAQKSNHQEAIERFNFAVSLNPDMFEAYYNIGMAYEKLGEYHEAIRAYKKLTEIKPDFISAYTKLWDLLCRENKFFDLVEVCKNGIEKYPHEYILHFYLGVAFSKMGRFEEALDAFKSVMDINSDMKGVNLYLGITLTKLKKYEEAIHMFRNALLDTPDDNEIFYNMSITYCLQQRYDKAIVSLKKAVELNPEIKSKIAENTNFDCIKDVDEFKVLAIK